jgi:hypothetical protein
LIIVLLFGGRLLLQERYYFFGIGTGSKKAKQGEIEFMKVKFMGRRGRSRVLLHPETQGHRFAVDWECHQG